MRHREAVFVPQLQTEHISTACEHAAQYQQALVSTVINWATGNAVLENNGPLNSSTSESYCAGNTHNAAL